jgi:hypothetical protein
MVVPDRGRGPGGAALARDLHSRNAMDKMAKILPLPVHPRDGVDARTLGAPARDRRGGWSVVALIIGALGLYWAGAALLRDENAAGIVALPAGLRESLYAGTLHEVDTVCRTPSAQTGELRDHCAVQARFLLRLPECTESCQRVVADTMPHAHR